MTQTLLEWHPRRIAVFRALQIGDWLCAIPAIRALKDALPDAQITLLGLPWSESLVQRFPRYFSDFIHFPGYPGIIEQPFNIESFIPFLQRVNREQFDLVVQMHGNGSIINPLMGMLGAKRIAGYCEEGRYRPDPEWCMPYPDDCPEVHRHLQLMHFLGIPSRSEELEFPVTDAEQAEYERLSRQYGLRPGEYVCVHPGARDTRRWWAPQHFARVADTLAERGYTVVLTGTEAERATVAQVEAGMRYPALNLVGKTGLGVMAVLLRRARMLFSNDTGVSHIAAAVRTPSVVIFLASDPARWAPLNRQLHRIVLPHQAGDMEYVLANVDHLLHETGDRPNVTVEGTYT